MYFNGCCYIFGTKTNVVKNFAQVKQITFTIGLSARFSSAADSTVNQTTLFCAQRKTFFSKFCSKFNFLVLKVSNLSSIEIHSTAHWFLFPGMNTRAAKSLAKKLQGDVVVRFVKGFCRFHIDRKSVKHVHSLPQLFPDYQ